MLRVNLVEGFTQEQFLEWDFEGPLHVTDDSGVTYAVKPSYLVFSDSAGRIQIEGTSGEARVRGHWDTATGKGSIELEPVT